MPSPGTAAAAAAAAAAGCRCAAARPAARRAVRVVAAAAAASARSVSTATVTPPQLDCDWRPMTSATCVCGMRSWWRRTCNDDVFGCVTSLTTLWLPAQRALRCAALRYALASFHSWLYILYTLTAASSFCHWQRMLRGFTPVGLHCISLTYI